MVTEEQLAEFAASASRRLGRRSRTLMVVVLISPLLLASAVVRLSIGT